jgi:hypothetical protein
MKKLLLIAILMCFAFLHPSASAAAKVELDDGTIESISEGRILIHGTRGDHILECTRECTWCDEGLEVQVKFVGYGRATIKPRKLVARPVPALVVRDGREEE